MARLRPKTDFEEGRWAIRGRANLKDLTVQLSMGPTVAALLSHEELIKLLNMLDYQNFRLEHRKRRLVQREIARANRQRRRQRGAAHE